MGQGLTAEKMQECVWLRPETVASVDFLERTGADHLRHTKSLRYETTKILRRSVLPRFSDSFLKASFTIRWPPRLPSWGRPYRPAPRSPMHR